MSEIWFQSLQGGSRVAVASSAAITLRSASLGQAMKEPRSRTSLQLHCKRRSLDEGWSAILCTLIPGEVERATFKIQLQKETEYELEVLGDNEINILGDTIGGGWRPQALKIATKRAYKGLPFLWIEDGKPGKGPTVNWGHAVSIRFLARVGGPMGRIYQQTVGKSTLEFVVGNCDIIEGFSQGIMGMRSGGMRRIHVPPSLGFGQGGSPEHGIPGDSVLVIECQLLSHKIDDL